MDIKKIYLAGSVPKSDKEIVETIDWRDDFIVRLGNINENFSFINPIDDRANEGDAQGVFGAGCYLIRQSDLIVVYAPKKIGAGTAQEMLIAKYFNRPVITVLPKETHHRRKNMVYEGEVIKDWIHPFLYETSDVVIESKEELAGALMQLAEIKIKDITCIDDALKYYEEKYKVC